MHTPKVQKVELLPGLTVYVAKTTAEKIITIAGSLSGGVCHNPQNQIVPELLVEMLDEGTLSTSKKNLHETLASLGASINFSVSNYRVRFVAKTLSENVPTVVKLLSEMLREPLLDEREFQTVKKRFIGDERGQNEDTRTRARQALARKIYPIGHPNHQFSLEEVLKLTEKITVADLKKFHKTTYGLGDLNIVAVGDVPSETLNKSLKENFSGWRKSNLHLPIKHQDPKNVLPESKTFVTMRDKASVDVCTGNYHGLSEKDKEFEPLFVGLSVLGMPGSFSARLMNYVREKKGLTYGAYAYLSGQIDNARGYWYAWAMFPPERLALGREAMMEVISNWATKGITKDEFEKRKRSIIGKYKVGLATTEALAYELLSNIEQGYTTDRIKTYPEEIERITLKEVNDCIKKYVDPKKLLLTAAGSIDPSGNPLV